MVPADSTASGSGTQAALRRSLARTARRLRHGRPALSVVVLASGADPVRLHATLTAVRDQPSPELELIVVTFDGGAEVARAAAGDDTRARFLAAPDLAAARLLGVRRSRGAAVLLAGPGDLYPARAIADLVPALTAGETLLLSDGPADAEPADLLTRPDVARAPYLGRVILPRQRALDLLAADPGTDPDGMAVALGALALGFTATPYAAWRDDRGPKPRIFTVRYDPLPFLGARVAADVASLAVLTGAAREQRALGALATLQPFLESTEAADDPTWAQLSGHAAMLVDEARAQLESLDLVPRAEALLAAAGRREELTAFALTVTERRSGEDHPTRVRDGRVIADLGLDLPEDALVVGEHESALVAQARRLVVEDGLLELELFVGVRHVDQVAPPTVGARLVSGDDALPLLVRTGSDPAVTRWLAETEHDHDAGLVRLSIPVTDLRPGSWEIHLDWADGGLHRDGVVSKIASNGSAARPALAVSDALAVRLRGRHGRVALQVSSTLPEPRNATVNRVEQVGDELRLTVDPEVDAVRLVGNGITVEARPGTAGFWTLPLEADPWRLGPGPLPSGSYRLRLLRAGTKVPVVPAGPLTDRLPETRRTERHRIQLLAASDGLVVRLDAPLNDDELGIRARWKQRARYREISAPLDERLVYVQSFNGSGNGDHPWVIAEELLRRRPDLDVRWLVSDSSSRVPAGATPLLHRSSAWYDVLARAKHLVINVELERWFVRREGQQILQTFHGYPSKAMGLGIWVPRGLLPGHVEQQLDQSSRTWNTLLTPDPSVDHYYRRDYAYDGTILALGSPRNDVLTSPQAATIREQVRARLGIEPGQRALLYAPTWRDDLATTYRAAETVDHLDVDEAAAGLGDEWVLLLRGHRFHAAAGSKGSRVVDVTRYPEINDLILAADAAVLDYSSLRFDFALTNRPMVFLVPDLDRYTGHTRGFLWDYRETAPGPLVSSTAEVVAELRDFDALEQRWAPDLRAFNQRYSSLQDGHATQRTVDAFFADLLG